MGAIVSEPDPQVAAKIAKMEAKQRSTEKAVTVSPRMPELQSDREIFSWIQQQVASPNKAAAAALNEVEFGHDGSFIFAPCSPLHVSFQQSAL